PAIEVQRLEPRQRGGRIVVGEALCAVPVGRGRGGVDQRRTRLGAPVEQAQGQAEIVVHDRIAVARRGVGDRAQMDHGVEANAVRMCALLDSTGLSRYGNASIWNSTTKKHPAGADSIK